MKNTYKIHLRSGSIIKLKADDFKVVWCENNGTITGWKAPGADRWLFFLPSDLVAVERVR